jgi:hypothetical protein
VNNKITVAMYPCPHCTESRLIDFANPDVLECPKCNKPYPKFDIPVETVLPKKIVEETKEVIKNDQD